MQVEREAFGGFGDRAICPARLPLVPSVARYEKLTGAKVKFDKSEGLSFCGWRGSLPCKSPSAGVTVPSASLGCSSGPASSWRKIGWKYGLW